MAGEAVETETDAQLQRADRLRAEDGDGLRAPDNGSERQGGLPEHDADREGSAAADILSDFEDPTVAQRDRAEGQRGPGLRPRDGTDPTIVTAWVLVLAGYTPVRFFEALFGIGYFGPLAWPAIVAMVGVLFAVIALLRSLDLDDRRLRSFAIGALALGMVRLFILPWF